MVGFILYPCSVLILKREDESPAYSLLNINKLLGAIHKRRRNILGGGGLKFRCCKILEGRSWVNQGQNFDIGVKNSQKNSDVFYGWPPIINWNSDKCFWYEKGLDLLCTYDSIIRK